MILLGLLLMSSNSVYDVYEQAVAAFHPYGKREVRRQERFAEREEKKPLQAEVRHRANLQKLVP